MVHHCCVFGCTNKHDSEAKKNGISFHTVPKFDPERSKWLAVIPQKNGLNQESIPWFLELRVCSVHFNPTDYDPDPKLVRRRLKSGVIPSIFSQSTNSEPIQDKYSKTLDEVFASSLTVEAKNEKKPTSYVAKRRKTPKKSPKNQWDKPPR